MDMQTLLTHIRDLTDLELAVLLSLISQQNILITTPEQLIDDLSSELALIASEVFRLSYAVISLEDCVSVDKFGEAILDQHNGRDFSGLNPSRESNDENLQPHSRLANVNIRAASIAPSHAQESNLDSRTVADIVVAKNFNHAPRDVQVTALELITRRRIYSHTAVHQVPKTFLFIPLVSTSTKHVRLNAHLNDRISISHYHNPDDGFANLEELNPDFDPDYDQRSTYSKTTSSTASSSHFSTHPRQAPPQQQQQSTASRQIPPSTIDHLRTLGQNTTMTPEIRRHIQDVVVFLRIARGVDGGVTPFATTQFVNLAKHLAPLHGIDFVTPSLVALAARKVYAHRVVLAKPERERSMQWGSDVQAVEELLDELTPEKVIDDVLATVPSPV